MHYKHVLKRPPVTRFNDMWLVMYICTRVSKNYRVCPELGSLIRRRYNPVFQPSLKNTMILLLFVLLESFYMKVGC